MAVTMDLIFAGLIAFVPNTSPGASSLTAYLVNAPHHRQTLEIYGDADLALHGSGTSCRQNGKKITCALGNTDVRVEDINQNSVHPLPNKAASRLRPKSLNEEGDLDWFVRMSKIQSDERIGDAKTWATIKQEKTVGARFTLGWDTAAVSELDGREAGKVALIGFRGSGNSALKQAVAESLTFRLTVNQAPIKIVLADRDGGGMVNITARCTKNNCLSIKIDNTLEDEGRCEDGDHFMHYYKVVKNPGKMLLPYSIDPKRPCVGVEFKTVDRNLLRRGLRVLKPAAPKGVSAVLAGVNKKGKSFTYAELLKNVDAWVRDSVERAIIVQFLKEAKKIQDRVICPPVLLEPA